MYIEQWTKLKNKFYNTGIASGLFGIATMVGSYNSEIQDTREGLLVVGMCLAGVTAFCIQRGMDLEQRIEQIKRLEWN